MEKAHSTSTSAVIKDNILRLGLDGEKLRGQCYDGCRTIVGKKRGVERRPAPCFVHTLLCAFPT